MKVIIDRFEGEMAVCEKPDRSMINIPRLKLPKTAKEGDVLIVEGDDIRIEITGTPQRKEKIDKMMKKLWRDS